METVAIVTDTNSGLTAAQAKELGVALLSMPFSVDGEPHLEGRDLDPAAFFQALRDGADVCM